MENNKSYTFDEAFEASKKYFDGDEMAAATWVKKYALQDDEGAYLEKTPDDMHKRMAKLFNDVEQKYLDKSSEEFMSEYGKKRERLTEESIYDLFKNFDHVIPAGSVMSGLGNPLPVSLSNCWVIEGPHDTLEDIFRVCNEQSQLMKRRGGVGFDISGLRPNGSVVHNAAKSSTGAASFMDLFSDVTNTISQNGRRGALMLSISVKHPDALEFTEKKQDLTKVTGANVSVQIDDEFMHAAENDEDYFQVWPIDAEVNIDYDAEYDKLCDSTDTNGNKAYYRRIKAKEAWERVIHCAWNTAEPGILFQTRHHQYSPDGVYPTFRGTCTNPCGEIFMHEDSCRLIHINLASVIAEPFTENAHIDANKLYALTYEAMRLADDLVDLEADAIKKILNKISNDKDDGSTEYALYERLLTNSLNGRRCGLGFLGLSDAIAMLGLKYDSDEGISSIEDIMRVMFTAEMDCQTDMALTRGTFPSYDPSLEAKGNDWYAMLMQRFPEQYERNRRFGRRNVSFNTVAPTGTVSMMARRSSGIEPVFMPFYTRRVKCMNLTDRVDFVDQNGEKFTEYVVVHPTLKTWAETVYGDDFSEDWNQKQWQEAFEKSPWFGSTAQEIDWKKRVELQGVVQDLISHSISSTVNLPNSVTEEEVSTIYMEAWKKGLKGITVYRDGCRSGVLVSTEKEEKKEPEKPQEAKRRPKSLDCKIFRFSNKGEKWVGVVGMMDGEPYEIFTGMLDKLNIPNWVEEGAIIKNYEMVKDEEGNDVRQSRYDLCYVDRDGYRVCIEGLSRTFNPEYWNYAKLISGLLRHHMGIQYVIKVISSLKLDSDTINTWKNGVIRTLRKFQKTKDEEVVSGEVCPQCEGRLVRDGGCIRCIDCGWSRCE